MAKDLEQYGTSCVGEAIYGIDKLDLDKLREDVSDRVYQDAENACIYTHDCMDIIRDYEREHGDDADDTSGKEYKASEWQEAMQAYAYGVAVNAIRHYADEALDKIEEMADLLIDEIPACFGADRDDLRVSLQCPHGWAPHDREDNDGICFWVSKQLDGCNAVAVDAGALWLSYTWTPADEVTDSAENTTDTSTDTTTETEA